MPKDTVTRHIYTVSEVTQNIKLILENKFNDIWIEGEASGFSKTAKGIIFFSLKDNLSLLRCVVFNAYAGRVRFQIKDGMQLICFGRISVYEKDGRYQLYVQEVEPKGIGSLQLALEQLKQKLEKEGLFKIERKRPIPYLPRKIGLVTSLSGAALKDILKVLDRRFGDIHIVVHPAAVQGQEAKAEIAQAISNLNLLNESLPQQERIEVMIVGRGGGSTEDLWAFNEEIVARAIYDSKIPVISAVGHERDWSIADLVADLRAPTPSVAAELVIPRKEDLSARVVDLSVQLKKAAHNLLRLSAGEFEAMQKKLAMLNPVTLIQQHKAKIADLARQAYVRAGHFVQLREAEFNTALEKLSSLSPLNILSRGYSITFAMPQGAIIKDTKLIKAGDMLKTRLHKGEILSLVTQVNKNG